MARWKTLPPNQLILKELQDLFYAQSTLYVGPVHLQTFYVNKRGYSNATYGVNISCDINLVIAVRHVSKYAPKRTFDIAAPDCFAAVIGYVIQWLDNPIYTGEPQ